MCRTGKWVLTRFFSVLPLRPSSLEHQVDSVVSTTALSELDEDDSVSFVLYLGLLYPIFMQRSTLSMVGRRFNRAESLDMLSCRCCRYMLAIWGVYGPKYFKQVKS